MLYFQKITNSRNVVIFLYLFSFCVYLFCLTPVVYWGDSAEFSGTSYLLDIPHQPAYPLYNLLCKLFTYLPFGEIATRCNFVSTFFASCTCFLLYLLFLQVFKILKYTNFNSSFEQLTNCSNVQEFKIFAFLGTLLYCFSYTFFNQATFAEVYTLFAFFVCSLILLLISALKTSDIRYLYFFVFLSGLSITHHLLVLPLGSAFLFFILTDDRLKNALFKKAPVFIFLFFLPLTLYLYLPFRSLQNPYLDWGNPENFFQFKYTITLKSPDTQLDTLHPFIKDIWEDIKNIHFLSLNISRAVFILPILVGFLIALKGISENFKKYIFYIVYLFLILSFIFSYFFIINYVPFYEKVQELHQFTFVEFLLREYPLYLILFAIAGILFVKKHNKNLFLFFIFLFFLSSVFIITRMFPRFRPYDHWRFFIICNFTLSIFITFGILSVKDFLSKFKIRYLEILPVVFFVLSLFFISVNNHKIVTRKDYYYANDFTENILSSMSSPSLILIDGVDIYFLLYYRLYTQNIKDKKLIFLDGLTTRWYFEKLKKENLISNKLFFLPELKSEDVLKDIINLNHKRYKLYYTATASLSQQAISKYCLKPKGLAYLVLPYHESCDYTLQDIEENKKLIYEKYKYRGIGKKHKDRKATGATNLYGNLHQNLARMYLQFDKVDNAEKELKKSVKLFPQNSSNYEMLAKIYYERGDTSSAIINLEKAVEYDRGNVYLMNRLGLLYMDTKKLNLAEDIYKKCLKIYPEFFEGHYNLGVLYQVKDETEKAIQHFEIARKIQPKHIAPYLSLGEIYYKEGDIKLSEKYFKEVLKVNPEDEVAKKYLSEISKF